ncbi:hypothetical protein [Novosphingobium sp. PY1]|uniref:hypothetical protein n=1 Tax=Novosphingobium sp. PY1 TaxID=1882221 RepID=UPI001A8BF73E|nr:hypothetical protein [Novosphingobium sp. PY1]GFM27171.1 GJ15986 [Novosphingobium sp. PY1]
MFKDRIGTATFSLTDKETGKTYTIKLQSNFINLKKFEAATGTDNPLYYAALNANSMTAPVEILYSFMIDFYDAAEPKKSLADQMDRDAIMGWLKGADDLNETTLKELQEAICTIMGVEYEALLAETEKKTKKKVVAKAS